MKTVETLESSENIKDTNGNVDFVWYKFNHKCKSGST